MIDAIQVLMVDDSENDYLLAADYLGDLSFARFTLEWAATGAEGVAKACGRPYDVILVDHHLKGETGLEFMAHAVAAGVRSPFVVLTGNRSREDDLAALRMGADDYVFKEGLNGDILGRAIVHAIERRKLIERTRRSEAKFRALFENTQMGTLMASYDGTLLEVNQAARDLMIADGAIVGESTLATLFGASGDRVAEAFASAWRDGDARTINVPIDGTDRWLQVTLYPVAYGDCAREREAPMVVILRDVSREVSLEKELNMLAKFPAENPHPVMRITESGLCDYANAAAERLLSIWGVAAGGLAPTALAEAARAAFVSGSVREIERVAADRVFAFTLAPVADIDRVYVFGRDITEERRSVGELRRAALVFEATDDGVIITDAAAVIISVNVAFTRITGYPPEEAIGKTPGILKSDRHDQPFYEAMWKQLTHFGQWDGELWNRRSDGETYLQRSHIRAVRDDQGNVTEFVSIFNDITGVKQRADELQWRAYNDALTGLPNRLLFHDRLTQAVARADRADVPFALMYIDLDGFKKVNDTHGHLTGDRLLQWVAEGIGKRVRGEDTLARLGGDEFAVIIEHAQAVEVGWALSDRILDLFKGGVGVDGHTLDVSASIGVAMYPLDADEVDSLVRRADAAMYEAKRRGKRTTCFYKDIQ